MNINFIVLSSNNDGFVQEWLYPHLSAALHTFSYIFFSLCMKYPETWQAGCYLGEAKYPAGMMEGWPMSVLVQEAFGVWVWSRETTDFGLTALFCVVWAAVGIHIKRRKTIKKKFGQTYNIWLYWEFHLHFVTSTKPTQLISRDFLNLEWDPQRQWLKK